MIICTYCNYAALFIFQPTVGKNKQVSHFPFILPNEGFDPTCSATFVSIWNDVDFALTPSQSTNGDFHSKIMAKCSSLIHLG